MFGPFCALQVEVILSLCALSCGWQTFFEHNVGIECISSIHLASVHCCADVLKNLFNERLFPHRCWHPYSPARLSNGRRNPNNKTLQITSMAGNTSNSSAQDLCLPERSSSSVLHVDMLDALQPGLTTFAAWAFFHSASCDCYYISNADLRTEKQVWYLSSNCSRSLINEIVPKEM